MSAYAVCSRPAVSQITTSTSFCCFASLQAAASTPPGLPPSLKVPILAPDLRAHSASCSAAAARKVSPGASSTCRWQQQQQQQRRLLRRTVEVHTLVRKGACPATRHLLNTVLHQCSYACHCCCHWLPLRCAVIDSVAFCYGLSGVL
jgi:hypothetical protein